MKIEDLTLIQVWIEGEQHALEFSVGDRTLQISGIRGATGLYERFFHKDSHPTRRNIGTAEMLEALQKVTSQFELYRGLKGSGKFFATSDDVLKTAREWYRVTA